MTTQVIHERNRKHYPNAILITREHSGRGKGPSWKRTPWANPWNWKLVGRERAIALYAR